MQTYDANYLNLANNMLKGILKLVVVGLCILTIEVFACLEV
jgi:hypothetical protein